MPLPKWQEKRKSPIQANRWTESALISSICKDSFFEFVKEFWDTIIQDPPVFNWHIPYLCNELQEVAERVFRNEPKEYDIVVNISPASTKSTIFSQMFPAWVWTRKPDAKFICASYGQVLALRDALRSRDLVESDKYKRCFPGIGLREDQNTKGLYINTKGGSRLSVGIGGAAAGLHGHFLIVDDPINPEQAHSEADLKAANRWMTTTLPTRKIDKKVTVTILIQQRLHQNDPSGDLMDKTKGEGIKHICLPGEIPPNSEGKVTVSPPELRAKYTAGLFDPIRLDRDALTALEGELGAYGYASQILQTPVPLEGALFKVDKIQFVDQPPRRIIQRVRSWDKAGTSGAGKYTVGLEMCIDSAGQWGILDIVRDRWGSTEREENIKSTAERDGEEVPVVLEIEGGSGGKESGENTVKNLAGYRIHAFHPTGDKVTRAYPFSSQVGAGNVWVLNRNWTRDYIEELRFFPNSKYSDQVDASSGAFNFLAKKKKKVGGLW